LLKKVEIVDFVRNLDKTGVRDMQMVEPDYWKGKGMYSKQACSRKITDDKPLHPMEDDLENQGDK
jgi:hypothetical protein